MLSERWIVHELARRRISLGFFAAVAAGVLMLVVVVGGSASLSPTTASFTLAPGTGTSETGKMVTLPAVPASADVEIAIDTTGSMTDGIADAVSEANAIVSGVQGSVPDTDFAVVQFKDFCTATAPTSGTGCTLPGGAVVPGDYPEYQVVQPMTSSASSVSTALGTLSASGGGDEPEAYNLVFHQSYSDSTVGWRTGTRKFVIVIGDAQPHGPVASTDGFTSCVDAGTDPNGLDTATELAGMNTNQRTLFMINETDSGNSTSLACYQQLAAAAFSGGAAVDSGGSGLAADIVSLINSAFATVNNVHLEVDAASPSPATASWITLPPALGPVAAPGTYAFGPIGINVPTATPNGIYTFDLVAKADGVDVGHETITVFVGSPSAFVIGDRNAAINKAVTFWGAQWAKDNSLSGGSAPASFKGFALNVKSLTCGSTWTTDPGNSAPAPAGPLPSTITVIVSSKITKSGSQISGDIAHIVTVTTNPGYSNDPGHAGTGTVATQVC